MTIQEWNNQSTFNLSVPVARGREYAKIKKAIQSSSIITTSFGPSDAYLETECGITRMYYWGECILRVQGSVCEIYPELFLSYLRSQMPRKTRVSRLRKVHTVLQLTGVTTGILGLHYIGHDYPNYSEDVEFPVILNRGSV